MVQYGTRMVVPPLTLLALEAIVSNFHLKPTLEGMPERFANAVAAKLSPSLDIRLTGPSVSEEMYWRRVCLEERGYNKEEVKAHGGSWKRMALELYLAELLELFGLYVDLPPAYDDDFCRPPLDSTNPHFMTCYPKVQPMREDGKPRRERVSQNSISEPGSDSGIMNSAESGWPHLERLKELSRENMRLFGKNFAWSSLSETDKAPFLAALPPGLAPKPAGDENSAAGGAGGPVSNKDLYLLPFAVAAERLKAEEDAQAQKQDDIGDCAVDVNGSGGGGKVLKEFLPPSGLDYFKSKGRWPIGRRGNSVIHVRSKELQVLLDRVAAAGNAVQWLELEQLPSHLDLELLFSRLPKLATLKVTYGLRHLGMRFDRSLFGMRLRDAESLSRCLLGTNTLHTLCLPSNMIDDNALLTFLPGLLENNSIQHLDLSHNAITSTGLQQLCKKLKQAIPLPGSLSGSSSAGVCPLRVLNLSDNKIDERGGRYLARTFKANGESLRLRELHLRLNELGDDGGRAVADGLRESSTGLRASLKVIDLSANG
jgi:Leucine Rich repeat